MIGDVAAIDALCSAGHDPNVKMTRWYDSEPLGWAASFGQCRAIEALVAHGADPRRPANLAGNTPLKDAQRERHTKAIQLLEDYLSGRRLIGKRTDEREVGGTPMVAQVVATPVLVGSVMYLMVLFLYEIAARLRAE